eukprot:Rmarinus@m.17990
MAGGKYRFAMVCASNMNRSMEAHKQLQQRFFRVESYGTGGKVKLPGKKVNTPNVYEFGTPYQDIYNDLVEQDREWYDENGLLDILKRNVLIKLAPSKWQDEREVYKFDVVVTFEERVYCHVLEDYYQARLHLDRSSDSRADADGRMGDGTITTVVVDQQLSERKLKGVYVINLETKDSTEDALAGAMRCVHLCEKLEIDGNLDVAVESVIQAFENDTQKQVLHTVLWF